jgi:outer membrane protein assembly factor BamB
MKKAALLYLVISVVTLMSFAGPGSGSSKYGDQNTSTAKNAGTVDLSGKVTGWRDDNRTGVSSEKGLLKSWPAEGPSLVWMNNNLPAGHSSVAIGNNTIYITGIDSQSDILVALDNKGNVKWQTPYGRCWNQSNPESRSTPTIDGDKIFVSSGNGDLACIDAGNGKIIWSAKTSEMYKGTYGSWGIAESLLVDGNKVYFSPGGPETMTVALNKTNGSLVWKTASLNDKPGYVSPILVNYAGKKMLINVSLGHVYGVDVTNGEILWKASLDQSSDPGLSHYDLIKCTTPLFNEGMVYVTGGYDTGGMMIRIASDGKSASVVWTDKVLDNHHGGVLLINGYIYGSNWINNGTGDWCCIDWKTGKTMYQTHWKCKGSIIAADGMLYAYDERSGFLGLVKVDPQKFDLVSSFQVKEGSGPYWSHPVIHNGYLYVRHGKALMVYDIKADR